MSPVEIAEIAALGILAGVIAGLFGVGGGTVFVPTLTLIVGMGQLEAAATSLLAIIPVAILGSWRQTRTGEVRWRDATIMGVSSVAAAIAGALIADQSPERALRIGFALLLVATAVQMTLRARKAERARRAAEGAS